MSEKSRELRGRTIPIEDERYAWWSEMVQQGLARKGLKQADLARKYGVNDATITRCVKTRESVNVHLAIAISDFLEIPSPVFIAASEREASEIERQRKLVLTEAERRQITIDAESAIKRIIGAKKKPGRRHSG